MRRLYRVCHAKINLTLACGPPRADGFHDIDSLVVQLDLHDVLHATPRDDTHISLTCDDSTIPTDESNLVLRAAAVMRCVASATAIGPSPRAGVEFRLEKRIPAGGGLGGGSSNAAGALQLLNEVWRLGFSIAQLAEFGAKIGSDVPLFLQHAACRISGRGEIVTPLPKSPRGWVVLILSGLYCATPAVYRAFDALPAPPARPPNDAILAEFHTPERLMALLYNDLTPAAFSVCPALRDLAARIARDVGGPLAMSGSGSTLFRIFATPADAENYASEVRRVAGVRCEVTAMHGAEP